MTEKNVGDGKDQSHEMNLISPKKNLFPKFSVRESGKKSGQKSLNKSEKTETKKIEEEFD